MQTRINKLISETGFCSRRMADKYIAEGNVTVNGEKIGIGAKVNPEDKIEINGTPLKLRDSSVYIAFNKPIGVTSTTDLKDKDNIIDFIKYPLRIFPIGRLDKPSEGLIFLTNDGDIVNKILRAGNNHEKEYIVTVDKTISAEFIMQMRNGVPILDTVTKHCFVEHIDRTRFRIILTQGLNRQIRRMCEVLGYNVTKLKRIRIMNVTIDGLAIGEWRLLTPDEIKIINNLVSTSSKTEEASYIEENMDE